MRDALEVAFTELRGKLGNPERLTATHADPFYNLVHEPSQTMELHRRLGRWTGALARDGWEVRVESLAALVWRAVDESGRWTAWEAFARKQDYRTANRSMRDVLSDGDSGELQGLCLALAPLLSDETPNRLLLLTDAALLHPWFRVRTLETRFHDKIRCPTVLFYPGRRAGQFGLHFLGFYAEDGNYRSTIVGGTP